jgi:hypothetical protein
VQSAVGVCGLSLALRGYRTLEDLPSCA